MSRLLQRTLEENLQDDLVDDFNGNYQDGYDEKYCKVYDGSDWYTIFIQLLVAAIALGSLWFKRLQEVPRRTFRTWFLDVSKQAFGAGYAHILNMVRCNQPNVFIRPEIDF